MKCYFPNSLTSEVAATGGRGAVTICKVVSFAKLSIVYDQNLVVELHSAIYTSMQSVANWTGGQWLCDAVVVVMAVSDHPHRPQLSCYM